MQEREIRFPSAGGRADIQGKLWLPKEQPRAMVQIVHGMSEHLERYRWLAAELIQEGYAVGGINHLGHGASLIEDRFGYFGGRGSHAFLVADVLECGRRMVEWFNGIPFFLLGHSMGSFVSRLAVVHPDMPYDALVLSGTSGGGYVMALGERLASAIARIKGETYTSPLLVRLFNGTMNKRVRDARTPDDWICRDPAVVDAYRADPLCGFPFTAIGYRELFHMLCAVNAPAWAKQVPKGLPILLLSGDMDPVGDYGEGVKKVFHRLQAAGVQDVQLRLYPGARHEVLAEINTEQVVDDMLSWMQRQRDALE